MTARHQATEGRSRWTAVEPARRRVPRREPEAPEPVVVPERVVVPEPVVVPEVLSPETVCESRAPSPRPLPAPAPTRALRVVVTRANGRRRWALDFLVRAAAGPTGSV